MKNFKVSKKDTFDFYTEVVKSKKNTQTDPEYKNRLASLTDNIKKFYAEYDLRFEKNELAKLTCHGYKGQDLIDLHKLYGYSQKPFQALKNEITTTSKNRKISTCQNCTISEINSFDHFVPQTEFAEFVVNPKNLIPSCTICNGYKSTQWRQGDKSLMLNLYLDILPDEQYLFVNLEVGEKDIDIMFFLNNYNGIMPDLYNLIENHYKKLHLLDRFKESSDVVVTGLINSIVPRLDKLSIKDIAHEAKETCILNMKVFGANYWKSILELALINNVDFIKHHILVHKKK